MGKGSAGRASSSLHQKDAPEVQCATFAMPSTKMFHRMARIRTTHNTHSHQIRSSWRTSRRGRWLASAQHQRARCFHSTTLGTSSPLTSCKALRGWIHHAGSFQWLVLTHTTHICLQQLVGRVRLNRRHIQTTCKLVMSCHVKKDPSPRQYNFARENSSAFDAHRLCHHGEQLLLGRVSRCLLDEIRPDLVMFFVLYW